MGPFISETHPSSCSLRSELFWQFTMAIVSHSLTVVASVGFLKSVVVHQITWVCLKMLGIYIYIFPMK